MEMEANLIMRKKFCLFIFLLFIIFAQNGFGQDYYTVISREEIIPSQYFDKTTRVDIQTNEKSDYYGFTEETPLKFRINGRTTVELKVILDYYQNLFGDQNFLVDIFMDGKRYETFEAKTTPDVNAYYEPREGNRPGKIRTFEIEIPFGYHSIEIYLKQSNSRSARANLFQLREIIQEKEAALKNVIFQVGFWGIYDNNLLKLSDEEIDNFIDNYPSDRWIEMTTADDFITIPFLRLELYRRFPENFASNLNLEINPQLYAMNSVNNSVNFKLSLNQNFSYSTKFFLNASYTPQEYYGHLLDENVYRPAYYQKISGQATLNQRFGLLEFNADYQTQLFSFEEDLYQNRDKITHLAGGGLEIGLTSTFFIWLNGHLIKTQASNVDEEIDVSYWGYRGGAGIKSKFLDNRLGIDIDYYYTWREFDSPIETDYLHYQRNDTQHSGTTAFDYQLTRHVYLNVTYDLTYNDAETVDAPITYQSDGDWTSFWRHKVTSGIIYKF